MTGCVCLLPWTEITNYGYLLTNLYDTLWSNLALLIPPRPLRLDTIADMYSDTEQVV